MKSLRIIINIIIVVVGLILMVHYGRPNDNEIKCRLYNEFKDLNLNGVIINKYFDRTQHSYPTIEIRSIENDSIQKFYLVRDRSNLFNLLRINDTILKEIKYAVVFRKQNGEFIKLDSVDFDCK